MLDANNKIAGFAHPGRIARFHRVRAAVLAQLVATLALIVAIAISAVTVTMEIAEAGVLTVHETGGGVACAAFLALAVIAGVGGQPAYVLVALGVPGVVLSAVFAAILATVPARYAAAELRRMAAREI